MIDSPTCSMRGIAGRGIGKALAGREPPRNARARGPHGHIAHPHPAAQLGRTGTEARHQLSSRSERLRLSCGPYARKSACLDQLTPAANTQETACSYDAPFAWRSHLQARQLMETAGLNFERVSRRIKPGLGFAERGPQEGS